MKQYLASLKYILDNGVMRMDRTGKGRLGVFCPPQERYHMKDGLPLDTTRRINPQAPINELCWFISGDTNIDSLASKVFWERWALTSDQALDFMSRQGLSPLSQEGKAVLSRVGSIGNLYGVSWRHAPGPKGDVHPWRTADQLPSDFLAKYIPDFGSGPLFLNAEGFRTWLKEDHPENDLRDETMKTLNLMYWNTTDQLNELLVNIRERPFSSRLRVTAMLPEYTAFENYSIADNIADGRAALTPCHAMFQFYVRPGTEGRKNELSLSLTMTSNDYPVGRVYNIVQYAMLLSMVAHVTDCEAGELIVNTNDGHIYSDQIELVKEHITREPLPLPRLWLNPDVKDLFAFTPSDIRIEGYSSHPPIAYPVAV